MFGFVTNPQGTQFLIHLRVGCHILQTRNNFVTKMPHSVSFQFGCFCIIVVIIITMATPRHGCSATACCIVGTGASPRSPESNPILIIIVLIVIIKSSSSSTTTIALLLLFYVIFAIFHSCMGAFCKTCLIIGFPPCPVHDIVENQIIFTLAFSCLSPPSSLLLPSEFELFSIKMFPILHQ